MPDGAASDAVTLPPPMRLEAPPALTTEYQPGQAQAALPQVSSKRAPDLTATVPGYEILSELGRGGMGVVYKARHLGLNRLVALKMVLAGNHASQEERQRFRVEAEAVAQLHHSNIIQIHDIGEADGRPYFSLEFVSGGSLERHLQGQPQPPRVAARLVEQLSRAMQVAHTKGIIHRDLKPANILLARDDRLEENPTSLAPDNCLLTAIPKITDFGLAKSLDSDSSQTRTGTILGTPSYMAPEQAEGHKNISPSVDVYALGAILYEMLTGRPPFRAATPFDTVIQVVSEEPVPPRRLQSTTPKDLETICLKCLEKDPRKRYLRAADLADDLQRFLNNEPTLARPAGTVERVAKWCRRRPAIAVLLVLCFMGVLGVVWQWRRAAIALVEVERQKEQAEQERTVAQAARHLAEQERQRAQSLLYKAVESVDRMIQRAADPRLARLAGFQDERRRMLEEAVAFQRELLQTDSKDPTVRRETGRALFKMAELYWNLGRNSEAEKACREAITIQESLLNSDTVVVSEKSRYRHDLAQSLEYLGHILSTVAQIEESLAAYKRALALSERLFDEAPGSVPYGKTLVMAHVSVGYYGLRDFDTALRHLRAALDVAQKLNQANPADADCQCLLASSYIQLATVLYTRRGLSPEAEQLVEQALALMEPPNSSPPVGAANYELVMAQLCWLRGTMALGMKKPEQAKVLIRRTIEVYENLLRVQPKSFVYLYQLGPAYMSLAQTIESTEPAGAEAAYKRAIETAEELGRNYPAGRFIAGGGVQYRNALWLFWIRQGELQKAVADAEAFAERQSAGGNSYNAACIHALVADAITKQSNRPVAERERDAESHRQFALTWLRKTQGQKYFLQRRTIEHMKQDADLQGLRAHPDFQRWLQGVEAAGPPPTSP